MTVQTGNIDRAIQALSIGVYQEIQARKAELEPDALQETEQQIQLPIAGEASVDMTWAEIDLDFDVIFHRTGTQRDSTLVRPHFTHGFEQTAGYPVTVTAMVSRWKTDARLSISGATVKIGVSALDFPPTNLPFKGVVHLRFQGWGATPEVDESTLADSGGHSG